MKKVVGPVELIIVFVVNGLHFFNTCDEFLLLGQTTFIFQKKFVKMVELNWFWILWEFTIQIDDETHICSVLFHFLGKKWNLDLQKVEA